MLTSYSPPDSMAGSPFDALVDDGASSPPEQLQRSLLTLLFTDIVGSTQTVERLGDEAWYALLTRHDEAVRAQLMAFAGREVDSAGDGFFAVFATPRSGIQCAVSIRSALRALGLSIRCGLHASECLTVGSNVTGLAVHLAARVASAAAPGEILVSRAVRDLTSSGGLGFATGRFRELRGLRGLHELFAVEAAV